MVQSVDMQIDALHCPCSPSEGDLVKASTGLSPNAEAQQRAMHRYHRHLRTDPQLQVCMHSQHTLQHVRQSCSKKRLS